MNDLNWWLMALSFVLGLLSTFAFMIRRVHREVPIYAALGRGPGVDAAGNTRDAATGSAAALDEPYGAGSLRLPAAAGGAPSGYTVKGNEDSMLYHTVDSPSYEQTIAEVWFRDEDTARRAGFTPWHENG